MVQLSGKLQMDIDHEWDRARRKAFWTRLRTTLTGHQSSLVDFDEVGRRLGLKNMRYLGVQHIRLEQVVGSVGRYQDFMEGFLPRAGGKDMQNRWKAIARLYMDELGPGVPPVEVFKVGELYFVKDGNHRVSVANELGIPDIDAYVWEYMLDIDEIPTGGGSRLDDLLLAAERQDFLRQTNLAGVLPEADIRVTVPGGYLDLLHQISHYQCVLEKIDEETIPFNRAVEGWFELRYEPVVTVMQASGVMAQYPDRTLTDLFVFITRRHAELEAQYHQKVRMTQAIRVFQEEKQRGFWGRLRRLFRRRKAAIEGE